MSTTAAVPAGTLRILIVDDETIVRDSLGAWFRQDGHQVDVAESAKEALRMVTASRYDMAFLDIKMPGMDGLEVLSQLHTDHPQLPVVIISGHGTIQTAVEATRLGAFDFVEKPIDAIQINRSNAFVDLGYALSRRVYVHGAWLGQRTHGGLRFGSPTGNPFFPPGEFKTGGRLAESDRILKVRYMQVAGGLSYNAGPLDVFASYAKYVWGRDAHNGQVFGAGVTWYFGLPE